MSASLEFIITLQSTQPTAVTALMSYCLGTNKSRLHRPWWPSGLRGHAISQLIVATKGPWLESHSRRNNLYGRNLHPQ